MGDKKRGGDYKVASKEDVINLVGELKSSGHDPSEVVIVKVDADAFRVIHSELGYPGNPDKMNSVSYSDNEYEVKIMRQ